MWQLSSRAFCPWMGLNATLAFFMPAALRSGATFRHTHGTSMHGMIGSDLIHMSITSRCIRTARHFCQQQPVVKKPTRQQTLAQPQASAWLTPLKRSAVSLEHTTKKNVPRAQLLVLGRSMSSNPPAGNGDERCGEARPMPVTDPQKTPTHL